MIGIQRWRGRLAGARRIVATAGWCGLILQLTLCCDRLNGQEVTGLQAAVILEQAMTESIARCEKSVVSIARVAKLPADLFSGRDVRPENRVGFFDQFGQRQIPEKPEVTSPDFVPNEFGTGIIVDRSGLILTNYHLLDVDSDHYVTTVDRKVFRTEIKAADPRSDLAVLQVKDRFSATDFVPMPMGNSKSLKKGHIVLALGNPYAIARDGQVSCSWGIVSNLARKVANPTQDNPSAARDPVIHELGTLIQTDAKLNLGTSGGALVNLKGEMVGLTTALSAITGYDQAAGYAIPADDTFHRIVATLKQGREVEYGFLGILPKNLDPQEVLDGKHGARILGAGKLGTPANNAGLRDNDVITHVGDDPIYNAEGLRLMVGRLPPAAQVKLTIERGGRIHTAIASLDKYPWHGKRQRIVTVFPPEWRGMQVDYVSAVMATNRLDYPNGPCVAVLSVKPDSPSAKAGLLAGVLITHVNDTVVSNPEEFRNEVSRRTGEVKLTLADSVVHVKPDGSDKKEPEKKGSEFKSR